MLLFIRLGSDGFENLLGKPLDCLVWTERSGQQVDEEVVGGHS
jgi:hypothetical protein